MGNRGRDSDLLQVLAWLDVLRRFVIAADAVLDVVFVLLSTSVLKLLSVYKNNFNAFKFR